MIKRAPLKCKASAYLFHGDDWLQIRGIQNRPSSTICRRDHRNNLQEMKKDSNGLSSILLKRRIAVFLSQGGNSDNTVKLWCSLGLGTLDPRVQPISPKPRALKAAAE
jgi:hypothetical protein